TPHLMDLYLDVVKLFVKTDNENEVKYFRKSIDYSGYILIHPFAGWKSKEWDFHKFINLCLLISDFHKCKLVIPKETLNEDILNLVKTKNISILITETINELIEAIKGAFIVIGCDSGTVYIASLLGKPTFTIYGPTNPRFSLPFGKHHDYIYKETIYSPKYDEQYGYGLAGYFTPSIDFMSSLSVDEVFGKILKFIDNLNHQQMT
ncbi:MAG: glycosyltransferase family 9 protein, partial [Ignavibacteriaceae bacterium]